MNKNFNFRIITALYNYAALLFLLILVLIFSFSCQRNAKPKNPESNIWEVKLTEMLPSTMVDAIKGSQLQATIPIEIKSIEGQPIPKASFILYVDDQSILETNTNEDGILFITVTDQLLSFDPMVKIFKEGFIAKNIEYEVGGKTMKFTELDESTEIINLKEMQYIAMSDVKIYYASKDSIKVMSCANDFKSKIEFFHEVLGNSNIELINPIITQASNISTFGEEENEVAMPINLENWRDVNWYYIHENIEHNLMITLNVYEKNKQLRFIGDGIAEWASLNYLRSKQKKFEVKMLESRLKSLKKSEYDEFDLNKWDASTTGTIEGYSYSLAFWILFENLYGQVAIKDFIIAFRNSEKFDNAHINELLETATGTNARVSLTISKSQAIELLTNY